MALAFQERCEMCRVTRSCAVSLQSYLALVLSQIGAARAFPHGTWYSNAGVYEEIYGTAACPHSQNGTPAGVHRGGTHGKRAVKRCGQLVKI